MAKSAGDAYAAAIRRYTEITGGKIHQAEAQKAFDRFVELAAAGTDADAIGLDLARRFTAIVSEKPLDNRGEPLHPLEFYTIHAHQPGGGIFRVSSHVRGTDVQAEKREISKLAEEGTRLRYEIIWEGVTQRTVGLAGNARVINAPEVRPSPLPPLPRRSRW